MMPCHDNVFAVTLDFSIMDIEGFFKEFVLWIVEMNSFLNT
jgi:hypothetical protein